MTILLLLGGLVLLVAGGEALVRGAASLGRTIGLSSLIIGLTVVSSATSAPELAVSAGAALDGAPGLAVGNVVGSNIANILFVLGLTAVFGALFVKVQLIKFDIPVMVAFSVLALVLALDGSYSTLDGLILLGLLVAYLVVTVILARRQTRQGRGEELDVDAVLVASTTRLKAKRPVSRLRATVVDLLLVGGGVVLLVLGAQMLVSAATSIATVLGVSDLIIGLTIVALGTSLPELATSIIAAIRGERDMAVGNLVGSCIFNLGAVIGLTSIISGTGIEVDSAAAHFDLPVMLASALVLLPLAFTGQSILRWEGLLLVMAYSAYVVYLVLYAAGHDAVEPFSAAMLWFVLPITGLWLAALVGYEVGLMRSRRAARAEQIPGEADQPGDQPKPPGPAQQDRSSTEYPV